MKVLPITLLLLSSAFVAADPDHWPHDNWWQVVFDKSNGGKFRGFKQPNPKHWTIEGNVIVAKNAKGPSSVLWTEESYTQLEMAFDFRIEGKVNSGVLLRSASEQIQIGHSPSLKKDMTGSLFVSSKGYLSEACTDAGMLGLDRIIGKGVWNRMNIVAYRGLYVVKINGFTVLRHKSTTATERGPVGLQIDQSEGRIEFRNFILLSEDWDLKNTVGEHHQPDYDKSGKSAPWRAAAYPHLVPEKDEQE